MVCRDCRVWRSQDVVGHRSRRIITDREDMILRIDVHHVRPEGAGFCIINDRVRNDNHQVPRGDEMSSSPVDAYNARAPLTLDDVRVQTAAVRDVHDRHLLAGQNIRGIEEISIDRQGSYVVQVRVRDCRAVNLPGKHRSEHNPPDSPDHGEFQLS